MNSKALALITGPLLVTSSVTADVIVDFTNGNAGTFVQAAGIDTDSAGLDVWNFDETTPLFDGTIAGSNTRIFGGLRASWGGGGYATVFRMTGASAGTFSMQVNPTNLTGLNTLTGILFWDKANFLNGGSSQTVQFNSGNSLSINFSGFSSASAPTTTADFRFVVKQGGAYYVSSTAKTDLTTGSFSIDPSAVSWAPINTSTYAIGSISSLALTNVEAVGAYFSMSRTGAQIQAVFNDFQANATVIPEPSAFAALAGLGALGLVSTRRRRSVAR